MVQFCPRCGTRAPDDDSAFCNKCGARLPPIVPVKKEKVCPRCGAKLVDEQSAFCNICGFPVQAAPPVPVRQAAAPYPPQPVPARPVTPERRCRSCGAPLGPGNSDYCNSCLATLKRTATAGPAPAPAQTPEQPARVKPELASPVPGNPPEEPGKPAGKRGWKSYLAIGLAAILVIMILASAAIVVPGLMPGNNKSSSETPVTTVQTPASVTTVPTQVPTAVTRTTTKPATLTTTAIPAANMTSNATATMPVNASATLNATVTATVAANVTKPVTTSASNINSAQPFSLGQAATDGKGKLTVNAIVWKDKMSDPTPSYAIGKKYLIVSITYENLQNGTAEVDSKAMTLKDGGGYAYDQVSDNLLENPFNGKNFQPQEKRSGNLLFIVPPQATFLKLGYDFGSGNVATFPLT